MQDTNGFPFNIDHCGISATIARLRISYSPIVSPCDWLRSRGALFCPVRSSNADSTALFVSFVAGDARPETRNVRSDCARRYVDARIAR
jgi:hypothetical protein